MKDSEAAPLSFYFFNSLYLFRMKRKREQKKKNVGGEVGSNERAGSLERGEKERVTNFVAVTLSYV